jgi:hypothetical protein
MPAKFLNTFLRFQFILFRSVDTGLGILSKLRFNIPVPILFLYGHIKYLAP